MAGAQKNPLGPTGRVVADNVRRLRGDTQYVKLAAELARLGRPIPTLGLRKIESYERRVDADDLVALAMALGTSPATLLMPGGSEVGPDDHVAIADAGPVAEANDVWNWLTAQRSIDPDVDYVEFGARAWPRWVRLNVASMVGRTPEERAQIRKDIESDLGMS